MELHKLASSLEEKLSKYNVKVFVGGSYALRHVYKLLDRDINDIDMITPVEKYGVKVLSIGFFINPEDALVWRGAMATKAISQLLLYLLL